MKKENILCAVPPMGWNSWNTFYDKISEQLLKETADAFISKGLKDAGYEYIIIDDCWSLRDRDADGNLQADPEKFPNGIRAAADYIHERGLKFGIYSCCGTRTCANYPGSFGHEFQDAKRFAEWGVDYLKYDNCHRPGMVSSELLYRRMGMALKNCGRDIVFAACQWGTEDVHKWIGSTGANTFRSTIDIQDSWDSVERIVTSQLEMQAYSKTDCFNDMDMLVVGMYGKGLNPETSAEGIGGCNDDEYLSHFALWSMMNSPLIIGCDIRSMSEKTKEILTNHDLIAINQDPGCRQVYKLGVVESPDAFVLVKPLSDGSYALGLFNFGDTASMVSVNFWDMGLPEKLFMKMYDCISHVDMGVKMDCFCEKIPAHGCRVYRLSPAEV